MSGEADAYQLKREYFGQKINFKSKEDEGSRAASIKEDPSQELKYIFQNPRTITLGNFVEKSYHVIHTEKTKTKSTLIKHVEGGWPDSVENPNEVRQINNWKRTKEKKEDFPDKIRKLIGNTERILKENLRMDVYEEYFDNTKVKEEEVIDDTFSAKIKTVFKDTCEHKRSVSKVSFSPEEQHKIAIAYKLKENESTALIDKSKLPCLIWDTNNPNVPINVIYPNNNTEITTCAFNNKHPNILGVGCTNGTIRFFKIDTLEHLLTLPKPPALGQYNVQIGVS
jgi:dynein intermediate chain 2